ncbi:N-acyl homoserine lactonase family protein [Halostella sp. JP-L12]|uniref:N-acyl homoserine lactonase family protein n=1 Tax=Halostella TaxID=1843185 RepID=UPI000EF77E84|nr:MULTISPECIES: N-acyl homoserine lactonase family protein [Halostella]NHN49018.1 N-acyl homoserine lactonase family protein [Halostella sp. JP-L12]
MPELYLLDHGYLEVDVRFHFPLQNLATRSNAESEMDFIRIPTFSLVYEDDERTVVVDTGGHPDGMDGYWPDWLQETVPWTHDEEHLFENRLEQVGLAPGDVDAVVQTHLHNDHAGNLRLFADEDVPVYAHRDELEWAFYAGNVFQDPLDRSAWVPADYTHDGLDWRPVEGDRGEVVPGIEWVHLPGHAPGMIGLVFTELEEPVFLVGDAAFREGNVFPETVQPGANWDHGMWADVAVPRIREVVADREPNAIYGHDPETFDRYGDYPGVEQVGDTTFR